MIETFFNLFSYDFMRHAYLAGTISAVLAGVVGYFVILRNLTFAAHALGHIGFAGASGALLIGIAPISGQFILTVLAALGMGIFSKRLTKSDMAIGIILSFALGLGSLFLHFYHGYSGAAMIILFGNLLGVSDNDLCFMIWLTFLSLFATAIISRRLLFSSLEPELAEAKGISLFWMSIIFITIMAVAVTLASQVVGIILVFILLIGPAAIAVQWTKHFWSGITLSVILAILTVWTGVSLAYFTDWPISFWISALVFIMYVLSSIKGISKN